MSFSLTFGLIACLLTSVPLVRSAALVANLSQNQTNGTQEIARIIHMNKLAQQL